MADPASLGMGLSVAGGIFNAFGQSEAGSSGAKMYGYQASVARMNADIAKQNARWSSMAGEVEAQRSGMQTKSKIADIKEAQSGSGFDVNTGTLAETRESQREVGFADQATIRSNAARRAFGYETEAEQNKAQAGVYDMAAKQSKTAGKMKAIGSLIGTAASVSSKWKTYDYTFGDPGSGTDYYGADDANTWAFGQEPDVG